MTKSKDKELLKACFSGNRASWEMFVEVYSKLVYFSIHQTYKIRGMVAEAEEVDDLYGSVFLSLFENNFAKLKSFRGLNDCTLASWIRLIASRKTLDHLRDRGRRSRIFDSSGNLIDDRPDDTDMEKATLEKERSELARQALLQLNAEEMTFINLCYERELEPEKIAEILGVTVSTVYSKKNRVREKLKRILAEQGET